MLIRIRRRLQREDGISLVETLISMFILSIGLLALLSTFTFSARSVLEQRAKANATRVATEELERLRPLIFDAGFDEAVAEQPCVLGDPASPRLPLQVDGRDYCVNTAITEPGSPPGYREVATTVSWMVGPSLRSTVSRTGVSSGVAVPDTTTTAPAITVNMAPNPVRVQERSLAAGFWRPTQDIQVTVNVINVPYTGTLRLRWQNDQDLTWYEQTVTAGVATTIPALNFTEVLDDNLEGAVLFEITTLAAPALTTDYRLAMYGYHDVEVGLQKQNWQTKSTASIRVFQPGPGANPCTGADRCENIEDVLFWLTNAPTNATRATVSWGQPSISATLTKVTSGTYAGTIIGYVPAKAQLFIPDSGIAYPGLLTFRVQLYAGTTPVASDGVSCPSGCVITSQHNITAHAS